jgi:transposase
MMGSEKPASRRRYSREFKLQVMAECDGPGALGGQGGDGAWHQRQHRAPLAPGGSQGAVADAHGFKSVRSGPDDRCAGTANAPDIQIQLHRGPTAVTITWPVAAAADCATWLRELLR